MMINSSEKFLVMWSMFDYSPVILSKNPAHIPNRVAIVEPEIIILNLVWET